MYQPMAAGRCVGRLTNQIRRRLEASASQSGVSGSQGRILHFILAQSEDVFQRDVEQEFFLRPSSATQILKLMEKNGLICRESTAHDARLKKIIVTGKAAEIKDKVVADCDELERDLVREIEPEDLAVFFRVAGQMIKNLTG